MRAIASLANGLCKWHIPLPRCYLGKKAPPRMIETIMLIALGFVSAWLLALLLAPAVWRRAVRLTKQEMEATMPLSVTDIQADKDILRAEYAVEMRRLELALEQAKQRAARHLMERNRHMVDMGKLESEIAALKDTVAERTKAGSVMEQTVRKRLPELEEQLNEAEQVIAAREQELAERARAFENQTESLELAQSMIRRQEREIDRLREKLEAGGGALLSRWGQKTDTDEATASLAKENGELNAELSRLREQLSNLEDIDRADAAELRDEMQRLSKLMMGESRSTKSRLRDGTSKSATSKKGKTTAAKPQVPDAADETEKRKKTAGTKRKSLVARLTGLKAKKEKEPA